MKNDFLCVIVISIIAMTLSGCSTMSYTPSVSLDKSPKTIEAKVQFDGFDDKTPEEDHKIRLLGFSATNSNTFSGNLSTDVSNAIFNDFQNNQVFSEISKSIKNPDYIINGSIHRFTGNTGIIWYTIPIDLLWFVGLPCCTEECVITISVNIKTPDGVIIDTIQSSSNFNDWYTIYNNKTFALPSQMNSSLRKVVSEIREELIKRLYGRTPGTKTKVSDLRL